MYVGGNYGSDYLLLQIGNASNEAATITKLKNINAYWNGWNANNTATTGGAGIHHPAGDVKKISFFTVTTQTAGWQSQTPTHWYLTWSNGVTEQGSSGSPLFNNNKQIVGTLSAGSSECSSPNAPDLYGKMSYHWTYAQNGATPLKNFLDPGNTGSMTISGSYDPCQGGGTNPDPDPDPDGYCEASGGCDEYIGQVSLNGIVNTTGCNGYTLYQNPTTTLTKGEEYELNIIPMITGESGPNIYTGDIVAAWIDFNGDGTFSNSERVFYQASAGYTGSENFTVPTSAITGETRMRVRINYQNMDPCGTTQYGEVEDYLITLANSGGGTNPDPDPEGYCEASGGCDEYIGQVSLNGMVNTTGCNGYTLYTSPTTTLEKGNQYELNIIPMITGESGPNIYTGDIVAAWIDFNGDETFSNNERVFYQASAGYTGSENFTVPSSAITGQTRMRVRINYQNMDPCGTTQYGEVEDYVINIVPSSVGIEDYQLQGLSIYPNPSSDKLNFSVANELDGEYTIHVLDMTGKLVIQQEVKQLNGYFIDIHNLDAGMYQLLIKQGELMKNERFIKQ